MTESQGRTVGCLHIQETACGLLISEDGPVTGWTEKEMEEGFIEPEKAPEKVKKLSDYMRFDKSKAGTKEVVAVVGGKFEITWDEDGHPVKATRV